MKNIVSKQNYFMIIILVNIGFEVYLCTFKRDFIKTAFVISSHCIPSHGHL